MTVKDQSVEKMSDTEPSTTKPHGITRGPRYYGGKN